MTDAIQSAYDSAKSLHPALTLEMALAVVQAYESAHKPVFLTHVEKADIGGAVYYWNAGPKDIVNDIFEEIATRFIVRRRGADD